jgi:hypothetical protein
MSTLGTRPRPVFEPVEAIAAHNAEMDWQCERTGWTPAHTLPRWIADLGWLLGLAMRKAWLYLCAPMGLIFWIVAILTIL